MAEFSGQVLSCKQRDTGYEVILDRTAFYPEGGGQACDTGTLGTVQVMDVYEKDGQVIHLCDGALEEDSIAEGRIDWRRRFDLMQQHTGEHLLSGLIHQRFGYSNSGFHVGAQVMEVDFDGPIDPNALAELEEQVNALVWQNLPVKCYYPSPEELPTVQYRTKRQLDWPVRIVEIPGADTCACCGVHVGFTGEVGLVKILSCTKFHSGVRLEMVCGGRAYRYVRDIFDQNRQISQILSAKMPETAAAVQKLQRLCSDEKYRVTQLQRQVFEAVAASYREQGNVLHFQPELTGGGVRELAERIAQVCGGVAVVFSGSDESGYQLCLVSRSEEVKELGTKAVQALCGKGGGKAGAFQGTVKATKTQIEAFFQGM